MILRVRLGLQEFGKDSPFVATHKTWALDMEYGICARHDLRTIFYKNKNLQMSAVKLHEPTCRWAS